MGTPLEPLVDLDEPFALVAQMSAVAIVLGDVAGDHKPDLVVGAAGDEVDGQPGAGTLRLHDLSFGDQDLRLDAQLRRLTPRALDHLGN